MDFDLRDGNISGRLAPGPLRDVRLAALAVGGALVSLWLALDPRTADLAAQVYRSRLFAHQGFALWDNAWFGGHLLPGYSLVFPPLAGLVGPRIVGAASVVCSVVLFAHLAGRYCGPRARAAAVWFAAVAVGDLFIGRITFALGVTLALASVTAFTRRRDLLAALLAAACAGASPVAALFLALLAVAGWLTTRTPRMAYIGAPALITAGLMAALFPEGGSENYDLPKALYALTLTVLVAWFADGRLPIVRRAALLYAAAIVLAFAIPSPMGSNVTRLGALLAAPMLLCATRDWRRPAVLALFVALGAWQLYGPVSEFEKTVDNPSTTAAYYSGLVNYLGRHGAESGRVEVVPTATHWESVYVAERFALARGWESQLDERYDKLFYTGHLDAAAYRTWLLHTGVRFVALPDTPLERWGLQEGRLLRHPPAYLRPVWHDAHWQLFAVAHPASLLRGPGRLVNIGAGGFTIDAEQPGTFLVRVHFTNFWHSAEPACLSRAGNGWTTVETPVPGLLTVSASWSLSAAFVGNQTCAPAAGTHTAPLPIPIPATGRTNAGISPARLG